MEDAAAVEKNHRKSPNVGDKDGDDFDDDDSDSHEVLLDADEQGPPCGMLDGPIKQCIEMSNLRSLTLSQKQRCQANPSEVTKSILSPQCLLDLCQNSSTLQDLCLRAMNMDDGMCHTLAKALKSNSFLTSLDLRQNDGITHEGYGAILRALERNYDLWCSVMVVRFRLLIFIGAISLCAHNGLLSPLHLYLVFFANIATTRTMIPFKLNSIP
jgi:hypothetical protein